MRPAAALLGALALCAGATPGAARGQGFPTLDRNELVLVGPDVTPGAADTRGRWKAAPGRLTPAEGDARGPLHWLPTAVEARFADGFVRARFEATGAVQATLVVRGAVDAKQPNALSAYAVVVEGGKARLERWEQGVQRDLVSDRKVGDARAVEIAVWLVGPQLTASVYDGGTLELLATLTATDPTLLEGRVGVVLQGKKAGEQAVTLLTVRRAGMHSNSRRAPAGSVRYLAMPEAAANALPADLATLGTVLERRAGKAGAEVVLRTEVRGHERLRRAGVEVDWLDTDTPYKYVNLGYLARRGKPPTPTKTGFAVDVGYKDHAMVEALLRGWAERYPKLARVVELGRTSGGRAILALKISDKPEAREDEPAVLLNGGHHGSELLSIEFALDAARELLERYATDARVRRWVDGLEIWVVPLVNPDGNWAFLEHSIHSGRKNARDTDESGTFGPTDGVDLNRNYPFRWAALGEVGSRSSPRHDWYRGPYPASEPEVRALMRLTDSEHFAASISYHTVSTVILAPYTTNGVTNPEPNEAWIVAEEIAKRVPRQPNKRMMKVRKQIYPVDGVDQDHFRAAHGTVALLVEGAYHNPYAPALRQKTVEATRMTWMALLDRVLAGPAVRGRVVGPKGEPLAAEVKVAEMRPRQGEVWTSRCRDGRFDRLLPKAGRFTLEASAPGYVPVKKTITSRAGKAAKVELRLTPAGKGRNESATAKLCGDPDLLSIDQLCACAAGSCVEPGSPTWCHINGVCHRAGDVAHQGSGQCVPTRSQIAWSDAAPAEGSLPGGD